jgi:putative transposase
VKYRAIKDHADRFDIRLMCRVLAVSRAGYYAWRRRPHGARAEHNHYLLAQIRASHERSHQHYGSPRIARDLWAAGLRCSENRVAHLMRANRIRAKTVRRWVRTTHSDHALAVASNTLNRSFQVNAPNRVWASDITYLPTQGGWLYLAVVLDLYSRAVVGWSMGTDMRVELTARALRMAIGRRQPGSGLMHHSDRGVQYAACDYQRLLQAHGISCSMSRKGNCWDNACVESFFSTLKRERVYHQRYRSPAEAKHDVFHWIEVIYNRQRRHSALGYRSPAEFEQMRHVA